jgi:DNA-binding IclR family transcriptional regulator
MADERYNVPGLERGLRLLQLFDRQHTLWSAPDIARELDVPRSTVFRIIQTLELLGFVERSGSAYRLGPAVLRLGFEYIASLEISELARPIVEQLRDDTGFAAQLTILDGRDVVFVVRAGIVSAFTSNIQVGTRLPAHATVLGRMFLADMDDAALRALYPEARLPAHTPQTPKTLAELKKLLAADRERGYAVSESFFESGISAIAAPVRDGHGAVKAAVSLSMTQPAVDPKLRDKLVRRVLAAAAQLSHRLNYRPTEVAA